MLDALAPTVPLLPTGAVPPGGADGSGADDFPLLLGGLVGAPPPAVGGQAAAAAGKGLPADHEKGAADGDADAGPSLDPMLLWLPVDLPCLARPVAPVAGTAPPVIADRRIALPQGSGVPVTEAAEPGVPQLIDAGWQAVTPVRWSGGPLRVPVATIAEAPAAPTRTIDIATPPPPATKDAPAPAPDSTVPAADTSPMLPAIQPAHQAFAAAIALVSGERQPPGARRAVAAGQPIIATLQALGASPIPAVSATGDVRQAPLDLRRDADLGRMIDHIEQVRDQADAGDTRLRLSPDALGHVEVAVRRDGERVHVSFTAEQAGTRTLLAEAQPRLQALAEARGLKLGNASVSGGQGGQQRHDRSPERFASQPARTATASPEPTPTPDARLA